MNLEIVKNLKIPYPSLSEQGQIFSVFANTDSTIRELESITRILEQLKKTLLMRLLTGKIQVHV